ncbi:MAG: efflux transporter outer membrane subunit [Planctomycetota bacterium]
MITSRLSHFLRPRLLAGAVVLGLASCTVGPDYQPAQVTVPAGWGELASAAPPASTPSADPPLTTWWTAFQDPLLDSLVERAVRANPDLHVAQARVREARAERGAAAADLLPAVDASLSYTRSRTSENAFPAGSGTAAPGGFRPGEVTNLYQAGFDAAWEVDVFGGVRRAIEAADADLMAGIEDRRDVLVSLLAEVARNYIELRGTQHRSAIARANLAVQQETLGITRTRLAAGLASDLDVARAEAQVATTAAQIPSLEAAAHQSMHLLSLLLAQAPNALARELEPPTPIPAAPPQVPVGLPAALLRRRPDVRRAERELAAATARIGVATADLFPRFSLTGSLGLQSQRFKSSGDLDSRFWSLVPGVSWPVLDFGRTKSHIAAADAREEQALFAYQRTVLNSLREVEDALVAFTREQQRRQTLARAADSDRRAAELANELYQQGSTDFLSVLQAQRDLYAAEDALVTSDRSVSSDLVQLYKALGGGWEIEAPAEAGAAGGEAGSRSIDVTARR